MASSQNQGQPSQRTTLTILAGLAAMAALTAIALVPSLVNRTAVHHLGGAPIVDASLARLSSSPLSTERLAAANWLGNQVQAPSSNTLTAMSESLMKDEDPAVRCAVANALNSIVTNSRLSRSPVTRSVEPQLLEILETAYRQETNASVRRCIVETAGNLTYAEAANFVNQAQQDRDPGVQQAANNARLARETRDQSGFKAPFLK